MPTNALRASRTANRTPRNTNEVAFQRLPPQQQLQNWFQLQQRVLSDLRSGKLPPQQLSQAAQSFPRLSQGASELLWSDPNALRQNGQFGQELARLAPNAVVHVDSRTGYQLTARESYLRTAVAIAQVNTDRSSMTHFAGRLANEYPQSPLRDWALNIVQSNSGF